MITSVHIENFKCFKDFDIELGPFNVLIGPNDSGKTAFLEALLLASEIGRAGGGPISLVAKEHRIKLAEPIHWPGSNQGSIKLSIAGTASGLDLDECEAVITGPTDRHLFAVSLSRHVKPESEDHRRMQASGVGSWERFWFTKAVGKARYYRLSPTDLRAPSPVIRNPEARLTMGVSGVGFPTFLEDILRRDRRSFFEIEKGFTERFPNYEIDVPKSGNDNVLVFHANDGQDLPADSVSDGAVLYLAFLALSHQPDPPSILLIEEPENGVHHAALEQIVSAIRDFGKKREVQVVLTTHSPYLLDLVEPEDVRVFSKGQDGAVQAMKMSDAADIDELSKHFMTGEIWTVETESKLFKKGRGKK